MQSFLHAVRTGDVRTARRLLAAGAVSVHDTTPTGVSLLVMAAKHGHTSVVQTLCDYGANVNVRTGPYRLTATMVAAVRGHLSVLRVLGR